MNILSQRLKYAKRELTALKTAHPRGLGNLRVYRRNETLVPPTGDRELYRITLHLTFEDQYAPYPFVQVVQGEQTPNVTAFEFEDFEYDAGGLGVTVIATGLFGTGFPAMPYSVLSLAPVENITAEWEIYG